MQMKLLQIGCIFSLVFYIGAVAEEPKDIQKVDGVIHYFPGTPKDGMVARYQLPGEQI